MNRRAFLYTGTLASAAAQTGVRPSGSRTPAKPIVFVGDGVRLTPAEYGKVLAELGESERDVYTQGGVVGELESRMATLLGKEGAMFMPTGTMANHLALRVLAGDRRRVLVQRESHTYNDEGDGAGMLSGLNLVPLASGRATYTLEEVEGEIRHFETNHGYRVVPVGAIEIESPVRRRMGEAFDFQEMKKISEYARRNQIGLHLDGARLFLAQPYTGITPAQYAALFDTVYISLYKYLGAGSGAILAGPRNVLANLAPLRHQMGGLVYGAWMSAAVALRSLESFGDRFAKVHTESEQFLKLIAKDDRVRVERVSMGTNIAMARLSVGDISPVLEKLAASGMLLRQMEKGSKTLLLQFNDSMLQRPAGELAQNFVQALG